MKPYSIFLQRNGTYFLNKPRNFSHFLQRVATDLTQSELISDKTETRTVRSGTFIVTVSAMVRRSKKSAPPLPDQSANARNEAAGFCV